MSAIVAMRDVFMAYASLAPLQEPWRPPPNLEHMVGAGIAGLVGALLVVLLGGSLFDFMREPFLWLLATASLLYAWYARRLQDGPLMLAAGLGFVFGGLLLTGVHSLGPRTVVPGEVMQVYPAREWRTRGWRFEVKTERGTYGVFFRSKPPYNRGEKVMVHLQTLLYTQVESLSDFKAPR